MEERRTTAYLSEQSPHSHREGATCPQESWVSNQRIPAKPLEQNASDLVGLKHRVERQVYSYLFAQSMQKRKALRKCSQLPMLKLPHGQQKSDHKSKTCNSFHLDNTFKESVYILNFKACLTSLTYLLSPIIEVFTELQTKVNFLKSSFSAALSENARNPRKHNKTKQELPDFSMSECIGKQSFLMSSLTDVNISNNKPHKPVSKLKRESQEEPYKDQCSHCFSCGSREPQQWSYSNPFCSSGCRKQVDWILLCLRHRKQRWLATSHGNLQW